MAQGGPLAARGGLFVTGTDTDAGKTVLSAALLAAMAACGQRVRAHKPVVTGLHEPATTWPSDHELLAQVSGMRADAVAPVRYGPATAPHLAAQLAGEHLDYGAVLARARAALAGAEESRAVLVLEGVGGLLAPLSDEHSVRDLAADLGLPVVIAARPGLGTINHTLLTLEAARTAELDVRAVVLTPWPREPSRLELSNLETIACRGLVEVVTLARVAGCAKLGLARAGGDLPWRRWLAERAVQAGSAAGARSTLRALRRACVPALSRAAASTAEHTAASSSSSIT